MRPYSTMPPVTKTLLIANVGVFAFTILLGPLAGAFIHTFGLLPADLWNGAFWQPFTSMFLHGSFMHILMNMIALWSLGIMLERKIGSRAFAVLYAVSGLTGALFVGVFQSDLLVPTVGASGAIAGMLGAIAILFPETQLLLFVFPVKARTAAILFGGVSVLFSLIDAASNISHLGHLGGLVGGVVYTLTALRTRGTARASGPGFDFGFGSQPGPGHARGGATVTYYDPVRGVFFVEDDDDFRRGGVRFYRPNRRF